MVMDRTALLGALAVLGALLLGASCKVVNEDHCANQDVPGNQFCRELNTATPYCSPCNRDFHGCVDFEPFACPGYTNEIAPDDGSPMDGSSDSSTGDTTDTGTTSG
ncbi:MAG: hypothetical protein KDK70_41775 [Myxococcales bacterium]|nr:hypothetical protein [Myxococcales bacterium]